MQRLSVSFLLWLPLGCVVALFRIVVLIVLVLVDRKSLTESDAALAFITRRLLGLRIAWKNADLLPRERCCMVSNHETPADFMVLYRLPFRTIQLVAAGIPRAATRCKNHRVLLRYATRQQYAALACDRKGHPVHLFPEAGLTNGRAMLRFTHGFMRFARDMPVVPVAIRAAVPLGIRTHALDSSYLANLFWQAFPPCMTYTATVLPTMRRGATESPGRFVRRVQECLAAELGIGIVDATIRRKRELRVDEADVKAPRRSS